jgi:hypothetical protein
MLSIFWGIEPTRVRVEIINAPIATGLILNTYFKSFR